MAEYIERKALMKFPIRSDHCDKEHANEHFICGIETVLEYAENLPAADVVPVVRCKDCKYGVMLSVGGDLHCANINGMLSPKPDDYCACGEKKED